MYTWFWCDGASDCYPPEPDKEWIEIRDPSGEEFATIVHRKTGHADSEKRRVQKEARADMICTALNNAEEVLNG